MRNQENQERAEDPISSQSLLALRGDGDESPTKEKKMIRPRELCWDEVVRVGPGTLGGNYLRSFWWPVALSEEVKDIPVPVQALGEELVLFRDLSGGLALLGWHCSHRRASLVCGSVEGPGMH